MSLIYQALRQLHNDAETQDGAALPAAPVSSSGPETPSAPSRRKWWVIAVTLALVLTGLGAVWGARHLADRLQSDGASSAAAARNAGPSASPAAVQPVPQAPAPMVTSVVDATYFPPEGSTGAVPLPGRVSESAPAGDSLAEPMPSAAVVVSENSDTRPSQGEDERGTLHGQAGEGAASPTVAAAADEGRLAEHISASSAPAAANEARQAQLPTANPAATDGPPPKGGERVARPNPTSPHWSAEQAQLERARRTARERSSRIHRLVADLETAVALNPNDNGTIRALLDRLAAAQGGDDPYVVKMHAYWRFRRGDLEAARNLFQQVAEADESDLEAGINLALIEARSGERRQALARLNQLRRAHPDNLQVAELLRRLN